MGETPTHGKMKVSLSPTTGSNMSSDTRMFVGTACQSSDRRMDCTEGHSSSLEHGKCSSMGPLGNNDTNIDNSNSNSNSNRDEGFATVEWYGTIRLLVFVRKGEMWVSTCVRAVLGKVVCTSVSPLHVCP